MHMRYLFLQHLQKTYVLTYSIGLINVRVVSMSVQSLIENQTSGNTQSEKDF